MANLNIQDSRAFATGSHDSDGFSGDLGYPPTVELEEGRLLTIWYERLASSERAVLRQAIWSL